MLDDEKRRSLARQLRCPVGKEGLAVGEMMNGINRMMNQAALEDLAPGPEERVLEIGFGGGALLEEILTRGSLAAGIDWSLTMARAARQRFGSRARVCRGSVQELPYEDGEFTKIVTVNTVYFWKDLGQAFSECRRTLLPDGDLVVCFNADYELRKGPWERYEFVLYSKEEVMDSVRSSGFSQLRCNPMRDLEQGDFFCLRAKA